MHTALASTKNNEPAFPVSSIDGFTQHGMSQRFYAATSILAGFAANPAVFAHNGISGWELVNCSDDQLVAYAYRLADVALASQVSE